MILRISWSLNWMDDRLTLETELVVVDRALSSEIGMQWDGKKVLKWYAFSLKFDISLLLTKMGWINGIFCPLQRVFKIDQYAFAIVFGLLSLSESWQW